MVSISGGPSRAAIIRWRTSTGLSSPSAWKPGPSIRNLADWLKAYTPVLDGSLFTEKEGYHGPGQNTGVPFFKAPFAQAYDSKVPDWTDAQLRDYADSMKNFWDIVVQHRWDKRRWCAYIVDEVQQDARGLANFRKLQDALDAGSDRHVALIWTSHTDPSALIGDPATDVRTLVRWWSPNGDACNPAFLAPRHRAGRHDLVLPQRPSGCRRAWRQRHRHRTAHLGRDLLAL